jgi:NTP pyrophosphatase (non-canonical NTP hydrolase)
MIDLRNMNFKEFQQACKRTANPGISWRDANMNWALGIAGEAGEYCELIKKRNFHGKDLDIQDAKSELGDILYYVAMAASNLNLGLDDVAKENVKKLLARYPDGFVEGGGNRQENNDHEDDAN